MPFVCSQVMFQLYSDGDGRISEESMLTMIHAMYRMYYQNSYSKEIQWKVPALVCSSIQLVIALIKRDFRMCSTDLRVTNVGHHIQRVQIDHTATSSPPVPLHQPFPQRRRLLGDLSCSRSYVLQLHVVTKPGGAHQSVSAQNHRLEVQEATMRRIITRPRDLTRPIRLRWVDRACREAE